MNDKRPFCRRWGTAVSAVGVEGIAWAHRAFENKPAAYRHSPKPLNTSQSVVWRWRWKYPHTSTAVITTRADG